MSHAQCRERGGEEILKYRVGGREGNYEWRERWWRDTRHNYVTDSHTRPNVYVVLARFALKAKSRLLNDIHLTVHCSAIN